ncbi:MAG: Hpt domain-containing protein [Campylobacterales bacterium]|nr:Hpt domain-containing protein [Campylobacterales bacterium]
MLLYNAKKEFIGIDEKDLKTLGFSNLSGLRSEVSDFADLFVKTPGFIHNFKHVHWIDFITCADSTEESKVIINVNNKNFRAKVTIEKVFLTDNTSANGYIVYLNNLRELTKSETDDVSADIVARPVIKDIPAAVTAPVIDTFDIPEESEPEISTVTIDPYEAPLEVDFDAEESLDEVMLEEETSDVSEKLSVEDSLDDMLDVGDLTLDEEVEVPVSTMQTTSETADETFDNGYVYDPQVASDELGLPLDLIEEFIQDFIAQAKEFKDDIYGALDSSELDQVKILSHKLKGVAANLRIEDAFEVLAVVNTSDDVNIIEKNLNIFYKIIAKLAGEEPVVVPKSEPEVPIVEPVEEIQEKPEPANESDEEDLYSDLLDVEDSQVPQKIDMPELADDDFVAEDVDTTTLDDEIAVDMDDLDLLDIDTDISVEDEIALDIDEAPEFEDLSAPIYSKEASAADIGIDIDTFNELFEDYIHESNTLLSEIKSAIDTGDFDSCKHEALKLEGMSENMRVTGFSDELATLMHSQDSEALHIAADTIQGVISQISKAGA